jgi:hypothetical protein
MIVNLDMDAAVRLVERKQAERDRIAADLQDRAILADIAVAQYKRPNRGAGTGGGPHGADLRRRLRGGGSPVDPR